MLKSKIKIVIGISLSLILLNCVSLTEGGKKVKYITKAEPPKNCKMLQDTITADSATSQEMLFIRLRNKTAEKGGNFLVVDTMLGTVNETSGSLHWSGTGRGFICEEQ